MEQPSKQLSSLEGLVTLVDDLWGRCYKLLSLIWRTGFGIGYPWNGGLLIATEREGIETS